MTADVMARGYLALARTRLKAFPVYVGEQSWATVVREAHEAVELLLKAAIRWVGGEPSRTHEPSGILIANQALFPEWFQAHVHDLAYISTQLAGSRGAAFYGDERRGIPPDRLFDRADAERAEEQARFVLTVCERLMADDPAADAPR